MSPKSRFDDTSTNSWHPERPYNSLPPLPPVQELETRDVLKIANVVEAGIAQRQAASRYLKALVSIGVLRELSRGREKLFVHPRL